ncbi:acyltransferase family protein [Methylocella silvestris]|uniref:Acyltransferase 3 domain-containing protein n=1 Tax=Methylocella silvestris TaxID=199596 RepID=A0A2J7TDA3_METSI|nr:acyltransferase [Methylocella silvestris]PNG24742.1 hypothetical protein CR492_17225 [Methylocella silvestris]
MKRAKMDALQGLRGFAALLVVVDHGILGLIRHGYALENLRAFAYACGELGVCTFFVISGFIMVLTTKGQYGAAGAPWAFLRKRLLRIIPLYWIATLIAFVFFANQQGDAQFVNLIKSLTFIPTFNENGDARPILPIGWTLNYEMFFYVIFALALFFGKGLAATIVVGTTAAIAIVGQYWGQDVQRLWGGNGIVPFYVNGILKYFCFGAILGFWFASCERKPQLVSIGWTLLLFAFFAVVDLSSAWFSQAGERPEWIVMAAAIGSVVVAVTADERASDGPATYVSRLTGDASYSIYLTHEFVIGPLAVVWMSLFSARGWPIFVGFSVVVSIALGVAVFRYVETPLSNILGRRPKPSLLALRYER